MMNMILKMSINRLKGPPVTGMALTVVLGSLLIGYCKQDTSFSLQGSTMGTSYSIKVRNAPEGVDPAELKERIDSLLQETDYRFSNWQQDELYQVNEHPAGAPGSISADFCLVLYKSRLIWKTSQGRFDPTIGALIDLWGFGPSEKTSDPGPEQIRYALQNSGFDKLQLIPPSAGSFSGSYAADIETIVEVRSTESGVDAPHDRGGNGNSQDTDHSNEHPSRTDPQTVHPGCKISKSADLLLNLSAIAKGHGVDRVAQLLESDGIQDFMVEIGGEVKTGPAGSFRIGIERPNYDGTRSLYTILESRNGCVATSGNYRNFFERDGQIFSHILSPQSGKPALSRIQSATIVGPDCALADGLATAAMLSTPEQTAAMLKEIEEKTGQSYEYLLLESGKLVQGDTGNFTIDEYTSEGLSRIRVQK